MRRALLSLIVFAGALTPALAQEPRTVTLVLDRSASLRHADPKGRGPRLLAEALALAIQPGERLAVIPTGGASVTPGKVQDDPASLTRLLKELLAAKPRAGGVDLRQAIRQACKLSGAKGLVVIYSDDDLDVVSPEGRVPPAVMARARRGSARPTRYDVNQAARALLVEQVQGLERPPRILGLRAPLPARGRSTPFLEEIGAKLVALSGDDFQVVSQLSTRVWGDPLLAKVVTLEAGARTLALPYPARVTLSSAAAVRVPGAVPLDGQAGRLWLADVQGKLELPGAGRLRCLIVPRLAVPEGVIGYRMQQGVVRVVAPKETTPGGGLAVRYDGKDLPLAGDPRSVRIQTRGSDLPLVLLRVVTEGERRLVTARRVLTVVDAVVTLEPQGEARVGQVLQLKGKLPPGLTVRSLPLEIREGSGAIQRVELQPHEGGVRGSLTPQSPGPLTLKSEGELPVRLAKPVRVADAPRYAVTITSLSAGGKELGAQAPLELQDGKATLKLTLNLDPKPPRAIDVEAALVGAPAGVRIEPGGPWTVADTLEVELVVHWPEGAETGAEVGFRARGVKGTAVPATRSFRVEPPPALWRQALAGGLLLLAILWVVLLLGKRGAEARFAAAIATRQLRTLGANGRISPERYLFKDYAANDEQSVLIQPEAFPGGDLVFTVRDDGQVTCEARDGAKIIHADRPTVLAEKVVLGHGTAFAMVHGQRALRYVYLEGEPSAEELSVRWLGDAASMEAEMRDSGVFVLLEEDQNITKYSARLEASTEIFPESEEVFESESAVTVAPSDASREDMHSDEGILIMDSAEGEILDSQDIDFLEDSKAETDIGHVDDVSDISIKMDDLMSGGED